MVSRLAVIPVRTGSKRLPGKNTKDFFGKPIFCHTLEAAQQAGLFDDILVSSESAEVAKIAEQYGNAPDFLRPDELANDTATLAQVLEHALDTYESRGKTFTEVCLLWATAPMRTSEDIVHAHELLQTPAVEAVVGVGEFGLPVMSAQYIDSSGHLEPLFPDMVKASSQHMPKVVCDNGTLCWVKVSAFREHGSWLPPKTVGYEMPAWASQDIETQEDWDLAAYFYEKHFALED